MIQDFNLGSQISPFIIQSIHFYNILIITDF